MKEKILRFVERMLNHKRYPQLFIQNKKEVQINEVRFQKRFFADEMQQMPIQVLDEIIFHEITVQFKNNGAITVTRHRSPDGTWIVTAKMFWVHDPNKQ